MDDLFKVIFFLVVAGMIIYGIIMLIILLLPFIISGIIIYFEGKQFKGQIERYQLTSTSKMTLVLIGIASLGISAIVVIKGNFPNYMIVLLSIISFLTLSIGTLGLWAAIKLNPIRKNSHRLEKEHDRLREELFWINKDFGDQNSLKEGLLNKFGSQLEQREKLEARLKDLCVDGEHPRALITLKEKLEGEVKSLPLEEIRSRLSSISDPKIEKDRCKAIEWYVLELERLGKETNQIHIKLQEFDRLTGSLNQKKMEKERAIVNMVETIKQSENSLNTFRSQRIILN